jgi:hypothetical protein
MTHVLTERTRTAAHGGAETIEAAAAMDCRAPSLEGLLAWLPALVILIGMPLLALATSKYILIPKMKQIYTQEAAVNQDTAPVWARIPLEIPGRINPYAGFRSLALVCADGASKEKVDQNRATLMTVAANDLKGKVASDMYRPGVLDATRARLLADFDRALGGPVVKEVYIAIRQP